MALYHLIYRSRAAFSFDDETLLDLLRQCRTNNSRLGISGILLYGYGFFIQMLEGEQKDIKDLYYNHIRLDSRHHGHKVLREGPATKRLYTEWAMAFRPYDPDMALNTRGFIDPDQTSVYGRNLLAPLQTLEAMEMLSMEVNNREP